MSFRDSYNPAVVESVKVDLDLAMTFVNIASQAPTDSEKKSRNQANARHAYNAALHMRQSLTLMVADAQEIDHKLERLKFALQRLGEAF
jgi:hypothetical protein